ncbi:hypothetical protein PYW08_003922 [Mythimna loreyi]|uniref:Uncharacterized protein n=1 Tax=Mythimna loreyi TaxID=667449 RepID=A0ACC2QZ63_9NEOP|nr:hypothetical protein PYW08_003922 [Mythimna loreyi]
MNPKTLLIFFIVSFAADSYGQKSKKFFRSDYTYIDELQSFYKIHSIPRNWTEAKRVCAQEQAILFHPDNDEEAQIFISFWNKTNSGILWLLVGLSDILVEGEYETVDGKSGYDVYKNWFPGEPNNFGGIENCAYIDLLKGPGYLADQDCNKQNSFSCKKTLKSLQWNEQCDMPYLDYTFNTNNGKCYKLHTTPLNWTEANALCRLEQSSLAKVTNRRDAEYLAKLTVSTPTPKVKGKYQRGIYHLGFYNRFDEGWQVVGGKPMLVDLNLWYGNYQPEGENLDQCGAMFFDGRLIDINCDTKSFFICEREVKKVTSPDDIAQQIIQPFVGGGLY